MIIKCKGCLRGIDIREKDFDLVADFAAKWGTLAKFYCTNCYGMNSMAGHFAIREDSFEPDTTAVTNDLAGTKSVALRFGQKPPRVRR